MLLNAQTVGLYSLSCYLLLLLCCYFFRFYRKMDTIRQYFCTGCKYALLKLSSPVNEDTTNYTFATAPKAVGSNCTASR